MPSSRDTSWHLPLTTPRLALSAGTLSFPEPAHGVEHNEAGLKLVLVLGGQLDYQLQSGGAVHVEGPAFHISLSETPFVVSHRYAARQPLQYLSVRMPMAALHDTFGAELDALARRIAPATRHAMATANGRAGKTLQALGRQIMLCPLSGPLRQLYLSGKALELTAAVMDGLAGTCAPAEAAPAALPAAGARHPAAAAARTAYRAGTGAPGRHQRQHPEPGLSPAVRHQRLRLRAPAAAGTGLPHARVRQHQRGRRGARLRLYGFAFQQGVPAALRRFPQRPALRLTQYPQSPEKQRQSLTPWRPPSLPY